MNQIFDINCFPYPIAQTYSYIPATERQIIKTGGVGAAIQKTIICFETVCRFCVWEMVMEYANLDGKNSELKDFLSQNLFFSKQGVSLGTWVSLMMKLGKFLRNRRSRLFMPEMPLLFYNEKGKKTTSTAKEAIGPFVWYRNRFSHPDSCLSPDKLNELFIKMKKMLDQVLANARFFEKYCLMAATKLEKQFIREGILLEGPARSGSNQFNEFIGSIKLQESHSITPDIVLLIHRSAMGALEKCEEQPFLCYPIFLFSAFKNPQRIRTLQITLLMSFTS
jgi:hypothetical protein